MTATLRDVAARAGVSASTASRAFSRPDLVDARTRERVIEVAQALHYQPNVAAQSLITGRTKNLGVVVPDLHNPFFPSVVKGATRQSGRLGQTLVLADTDEDPAAELPVVRNLARQVDGLVLCSPRMSDEDVLTASRLVPVVLINRRVPGVPSVTIDNADGVRQALTHLRALGHQRVGYVAGPATSFSERERGEAFVRFAGALGLDGVDIGRFEPFFEGGQAAADPFLLADVTGVLAYNDVMAIGLIKRLTAYGVRVPDEVSVVGFDDIVLASMVTPALTTVHIPAEEAGASAIDQLYAVLSATTGRSRPSSRTGAAQRSAHERRPPPDPPRLPTHLVVRETTTRASRAPRAAGSSRCPGGRH